ncbi:hypothetical protein ABB37_06327 [Leptomonas pyrrhocoris]|uniref:Uncharacterized protein n=1 Tax=Leptomonas pyrrhocoris TaxID=157538 RepID=A0A0N0VEE6_LEPPY|nr:hypothetical protein ABB37_06327 [Leptomonas pyrrhocoris]XP_015656592.1 hypothetical protein ABB37_06327 [Leptomonas pyrrhocoris]KPA78152.1 hypothetical protein ABB37_06327 [Leptomonas pyrrhocoris]KPA78153.1 hypothetical protein ABB37_06327 [Leptomonas pyrrhocoris]|eukprot:XP_015656591.1 hypothetical protein ABB37_06327 [Leptomonas pyrrhocoris]
MSSEQYWRSQVAQMEAEYEQIIQGLRDEVEKQRRRCIELMHEQAMQRATAAADVRNFCTQYVAEAKQQQQHHRNPAVAAHTPMVYRHHSRSSSMESVPLPALLTFLHEYSHGLLQMPENRRKRDRPDTSLSPLHHRLRQRMFARHRQVGRDDFVLEEGSEGLESGSAGASPAGSPCSPPMAPSPAAPRSGSRFANAATNPPAVHSTSASFEASPSAAATGSGGKASSGGGNGGPVMAASAFGLPTLPPR